jgi:leucyl aminopeptidase
VEKFNGKEKKELLCYGNDEIKRVVIIGLGESKEYSTDVARSIASNITRYANLLMVSNFSIAGESFGLKQNNYAQAFSEGLTLGSYEFNNYKTKKEKGPKAEFVLVSGNINKKSLDKGLILGISVAFARDLSNHPANILTPSYLAKESKQIADAHPAMEYTVFDGREFKKMGMGAFHGVAMGATEPAKMIIVEYNGGRKAQKPIALVGKGLTFDSGGISLKPPTKMDEMKFDMCGSATVMGVLRAVSELKPKINIVFAIGSNSDTARSTPITVADPHISNFISSIFVGGLREIPPESKVNPFPTNAIGFWALRPPLYSTIIIFAGSVAPIATP